MARPTDDAALHSPAAISRFVLTAAVGLGLDLWTKSVAAANLADGRVYQLPWMRGWLRFEFIQNPGAVFGIGQGHRWIFLAVSAAAIAFLTYLFAGSGRRPVLYQVILGMLLAGVLGNMYDRIRFAEVRDMIHALPGVDWPAGVRRVFPRLTEVFPYIFNVADSLLCVGVGLMLIYNLFDPAGDPRRREPTTTPAVAASAEV